MLILGIANASQGQNVGKLGFKTIVYFEIITTIAIIVGLVAANVFQPGAGIDMSSLTQTDISQYQQTTQAVSSHAHGLVNTILSLIPSNIFGSLTLMDNGVPGVSFVVLLATLGSVGIPLEGLAFIAGIDRILDMARTVLNVLGNSLAVLVISKWEGQFGAEKQKGYQIERKQAA